MNYFSRREVLLVSAFVLIGVFIVVFAGFKFTGYSVYNYNCNFNELPDTFEIPVGQEFVLDIDFEEGYIFSDDSDLFEINKENGVVSFTPEEIGAFKVVVIALRDLDDFHFKLIEFKVT